MEVRRRILHVDMDAFYASVEQRDRSELRGRPVLVGSDRRRGVVAAASYEARQYGCRSAQPMAVALRRCPHAQVVRPRFPRYAEASGRVFGIFHDVAPLVEPLSIDEAFLDVSGTERLLGPAEAVAGRVRQRIRQEVGLTASVGVAPNKFLAKLASDMDKPDGLTVVPASGIAAWLAPLPIERMWGVGPKTAAHLHEAGLRTFGDVQRSPVTALASLFGGAASHVHRLAHGVDDRPVVTARAAKSVSHEQTFEEDLEDPEHVRSVLLSQTEAVAQRLRRLDRRARTVTIKIRYGDFETITRSRTLDAPTDVTDELWKAAQRLFDRWAQAAWHPVRLIGMGASHLDGTGGQLDLFRDPSHEKRRDVDRAVDDIRRRFGDDAISRRGR